MSSKALCAVALAAALVSPGQAAPASAITFTAPFTSGTAAHSTRGYAFDVVAAGLLATHLSVWDELSDGLSDAHTVGLWSPAGVLLAQAVVPAGTAAGLQDGFRFVDIADVALPVGNGYVVGATFLDGSADRQAFTLTGLASAPGIVYAGGRYVNDTAAGALTRPTETFDGLPGGSLRVDGVTVALPAPDGVALTGLALLLALFQSPALAKRITPSSTRPRRSDSQSSR